MKRAIIIAFAAAMIIMVAGVTSKIEHMSDALENMNTKVESMNSNGNSMNGARSVSTQGQPDQKICEKTGSGFVQADVEATEGVNVGRPKFNPNENKKMPAAGVPKAPETKANDGNAVTNVSTDETSTQLVK